MWLLRSPCVSRCPGGGPVHLEPRSSWGDCHFPSALPCLEGLGGRSRERSQGSISQSGGTHDTEGCLTAYWQVPSAVFQVDLAFGSVKQGSAGETSWAVKKEREKQCLQLLNTSLSPLHDALTGGERNPASNLGLLIFL